MVYTLVWENPRTELVPGFLFLFHRAVSSGFYQTNVRLMLLAPCTYVGWKTPVFSVFYMHASSPGKQLPNPYSDSLGLRSTYHVAFPHCFSQLPYVHFLLLHQYPITGRRVLSDCFVQFPHKSVCSICSALQVEVKIKSPWLIPTICHM